MTTYAVCQICTYWFRTLLYCTVITRSHSTTIAPNAIGLALWSRVGVTDNTGWSTTIQTLLSLIPNQHQKITYPALPWTTSIVYSKIPTIFRKRNNEEKCQKLQEVEVALSIQKHLFLRITSYTLHCSVQYMELQVWAVLALSVITHYSDGFSFKMFSILVSLWFVHGGMILTLHERFTNFI